MFTYLLPVLAVLSGQMLALLFGIAAWVLMSLTYLPTVKFYGLPGWWAPLLPVRRGVLYVRDLSFCGALLDGTRWRVEGPRTGTRRSINSLSQ